MFIKCSLAALTGMLSLTFSMITDGCSVTSSSLHIGDETIDAEPLQSEQAAYRISDSAQNEAGAIQNNARIQSPKNPVDSRETKITTNLNLLTISLKEVSNSRTHPQIMITLTNPSTLDNAEQIKYPVSSNNRFLGVVQITTTNKSDAQRFMLSTNDQRQNISAADKITSAILPAGKSVNFQISLRDLTNESGEKFTIADDVSEINIIALITDGNQSLTSAPILMQLK